MTTDAKAAAPPPRPIIRPSRTRHSSAGPASRSASWRSSSRCRRSRCACCRAGRSSSRCSRGAAGAYAIGGGEKRLGWGAIVAAVLGFIGGVAALRSGEAHLEQVVVWGALLAATLRYATPLMFGALGGLFSERSGVINIALEGMMLVGAFFGAYGADKTGSWFLGLVIAVLAGAVYAAIHALFAITLRADQIVSGTALNLAAVGITGYLYVDVYGTAGHARRSARRAGHQAADQVGPAAGRRVRPAQPAGVGRAGARARHLGRRVPHVRGPAAAVGRRESAGRGDRRPEPGGARAIWRS